MKIKLKFNINKLEKIIEGSKNILYTEYYDRLISTISTYKKLDKLVLSTVIADDNYSKTINLKAKVALKNSRLEILRLLSIFNKAIEAATEEKIKNDKEVNESSVSSEKSEIIDQPSNESSFKEDEQPKQQEVISEVNSSDDSKETEK